MNALRLLRGSAAAALLCILAFHPARAADQRDDAFLSNFANGALDINDLYVFRSPANANNTVFIMTLGSFVGVKTKPVFKPNVSYEFRIDLDNDGATDLIIRITFGKPGNGGVQNVTVTRTRGFDGIETLAKGKTGTNLTLISGGKFRAAIFDDPFFFDQFAFNSFLIRDLPGFPRTLATAKNLYGPTANVLGIVLEVPSVSIAPNNTLIGVWARTALRGQQIDRCGRPFINEMLIPPVPRTDPSLGDKRHSFNRGLPFNDRTNFGDSVSQVFNEGIYHRSDADSAALKNLILPDQLVFQIGRPEGYGTFVVGGGTFLGNGRRIADDTFDFSLTIFTNGAVTTDNVKDDNGLKVTDASVDPVSGQTRAIAFPYIGAPNNPPGGPNP